jgi:hypothetical protein
MSSICNIPVSIGELWDKYIILLIKQKNINDISKLKHINNEIDHLKPLIDEYKVSDILQNKLFEYNKNIWDVEDKIRIKEFNKEFDDEFIELARSVYFNNDDRALIKKEISTLFNSNIIEVKSYTTNYK